MEFHVLGPVTVLRDGQPIPLNGTKLRAVLVCLLIHAGKPVTAEALIDELWGDQPPATAHNTLQTYVRHLRQLLEPERKARQEPRVLRTVPNGYLLDVQADCIDSERFEHSLSEGRTALQAGQFEAARTVLREGLSLWRGAALGEPTGFVAAEREADRLTQLRLVGTELRIKADLALGHHAEVVGELEHLARRNPLREDLIELLMLALYRCGRQAEALTAYRAAHERLIEEVGVSPCAALQEMQQRILGQDPALDLPAGSAAAPQVDSPSPSRRWIWFAASLLIVAAGIVAWTSGWIRPEGATTGSRPTTSTPVVFNEYELAVQPGIGYDLDVPPGQPPDWHSTNNPRSPDYDFLDLYRTSAKADQDQLGGVDLRNTNEFNAIHLVDSGDSPELCRRLPTNTAGNVPLTSVKEGSRICIRTYGERWAMLTITRIPADRAAVLFIHVTVLDKS